MRSFGYMTTFSKTLLDETVIQLGPSCKIRAFRNLRPGPRWTAVVTTSTQKDGRFRVDGKTLGNCIKAIRRRVYTGPQRLVPIDY